MENTKNVKNNDHYYFCFKLALAYDNIWRTDKNALNLVVKNYTMIMKGDIRENFPEVKPSPSQTQQKC